MATRSCLPVQQQLATSLRHSIETTLGFASPRHSTGLALVSYRYSRGSMCEISFLDLGRARSDGAIDNWRPEAGTDACRMPTDG